MATDSMPVHWVAARVEQPEWSHGDRSHRAPWRIVAEMAGSLVDAILSTRDLPNLIVIAAVLAVAAISAAYGGLNEVIQNLPALAVVWAAVYGLIKVGRWWRGVYPPERKPRS